MWVSAHISQRDERGLVRLRQQYRTSFSPDARNSLRRCLLEHHAAAATIIDIICESNAFWYKRAAARFTTFLPQPFRQVKCQSILYQPLHPLANTETTQWITTHVRDFYNCCAWNQVAKKTKSWSTTTHVCNRSPLGLLATRKWMAKSLVYAVDWRSSVIEPFLWLP